MGAAEQFVFLKSLGLLRSMPRPELLGRLESDVIMFTSEGTTYLLPNAEFCLMCGRFRAFARFHTPRCVCCAPTN